VEEQPRRVSTGWSRLFDLSFKGFLTPSTLKMTYVIVLSLIILYVVFNIILVAMAGNRFTVISFFISLFVAILWFFVTRVVFELVATVMRMRNKSE
jgi:antibiotic biosynthesis monooxygenase (ABM) superfamily enzyme